MSVSHCTYVEHRLSMHLCLAQITFYSNQCAKAEYILVGYDDGRGDVENYCIHTFAKTKGVLPICVTSPILELSHCTYVEHRLSMHLCLAQITFYSNQCAKAEYILVGYDDGRGDVENYCIHNIAKTKGVLPISVTTNLPFKRCNTNIVM